MDVTDFLRSQRLLYPATTSPSDYDAYNKVVQFDDDPAAVASGETTMLFSVPPVYATAGGQLEKLAVPIGTVQGFQDNQTANITPFPEIGSRLKRHAIGMASYQLSMSKVLTYHSSLMNALYSWMALIAQDVDGFDLVVPPAEEAESEATTAGAAGGGRQDNPGHTQMITIESELARIPFGILAVVMTAGQRRISRHYYEKCYIQNLGMAIQAGSSIIQENVAITATRKIAVPAFDLKLSTPTTPFRVRLGADDPRIVVANGGQVNSQATINPINPFAAQ